MESLPWSSEGPHEPQGSGELGEGPHSTWLCEASKGRRQAWTTARPGQAGSGARAFLPPVSISCEAHRTRPGRQAAWSFPLPRGKDGGGQGCPASTPALEAARKTSSATETQQWSLQCDSVTANFRNHAHHENFRRGFFKKNSLLVLDILKRTTSARGSETLISQREK